jgi:DNA-binding beta-propeller fold protein YncE
VAVDPTGKFAYVPNSGSNDVSGYAINATSGALKPVKGSPFAAGTNTDGVAVDPLGKFAYAANDGSNNVSAYAISTNGALQQAKGSPFAVGTGPYLIATCRRVASTCVPPPL